MYVAVAVIVLLNIVQMPYNYNALSINNIMLATVRREAGMENDGEHVSAVCSWALCQCVFVCLCAPSVRHQASFYTIYYICIY